MAEMTTLHLRATRRRDGRLDGCAATAQRQTRHDKLNTGERQPSCQSTAAGDVVPGAGVAWHAGSRCCDSAYTSDVDLWWTHWTTRQTEYEQDSDVDQDCQLDQTVDDRRHTRVQEICVRPRDTAGRSVA